MDAKIISFADQKLIRSYDRIGKVILDYINDMDLFWEIEMARRIYYGDRWDVLCENKLDLNYKPFIQWLIFSYKLYAGRPLIECIQGSYINRLNGYERDTLYSLRNTFEGLFKIYDIKDDWVLAKDIFTGETVDIWDNCLACNVKRFNGLFTRLVCINSRIMPIPGYSIMTNSLLKETAQYIKKRFDESTNFHKEDSLCGFIKSNSLMLHKYFLQLNIDCR